MYRTVIRLDGLKHETSVQSVKQRNARFSSVGKRWMAVGGARRNDLERETCNTEKHSRQAPKDWKNSLKVIGRRNSLLLPIFPVTRLSPIIFKRIIYRGTIFHYVRIVYRISSDKLRLIIDAYYSCINIFIQTFIQKYSPRGKLYFAKVHLINLYLTQSFQLSYLYRLESSYSLLLHLRNNQV